MRDTGGRPRAGGGLRGDVDEPTTLRLELRASERLGNYTPNVTLGAQEIGLDAGPNQRVTVDFDVSVDEDQYLFYCLMANAEVRAHLSEERLSGLLSLRHWRDQPPPEDIGVDSFEFWTPPPRRAEPGDGDSPGDRRLRPRQRQRRPRPAHHRRQRLDADPDARGPR
ncbi:MAG: hypothetical protein OXP68_04100 [Anaerolineaceae bacterium]|nr:hypothetical protein [Anaerolineaceae bacterium]MDE0327882.1 hypothetical protein [Anaerolineaceae bacterium]